MTRLRKALFALLFAALAVPAPAQTPGQAMPSVSPVEPPVLKVHSTGSGAKRLLRYKAAAGAKDRLDLTLQMSISMAMEGMDSQSMDAPPISMSVDLDVVEQKPGGDLSVRMTFADAKMEGPGLPAGALDSIKGMSAVIAMSDRGIVKSMTLDPGKAANPLMSQLLSASGFDKLSVPLPEEAMGVGAKWDVTQKVSANGITLEQTSSYEIVSMDDTTAVFAVALTQTAGPQTVAPPGMPPSVQASLVSMDGTGRGRMSLIEGALTLYGDMSLESKMVMDMTAEGQAMRMSTATDMKMTLARGQR